MDLNYIFKVEEHAFSNVQSVKKQVSLFGHYLQFSIKCNINNAGGQTYISQMSVFDVNV